MQVKLNGKKVSFKKGETILEIAKRNNVDIPTLCYHPMLEPSGRCGLCLVKANEKIVTSCNTPAINGMKIKTHSKKLTELRKEALNLIASIVPPKTLEEDNELTRVMKKVGLKKPDFIHHVVKERDHSNKAVWRKTDPCILCGRCTQTCDEKQTVNAIAFAERGKDTVIEGVEGKPLDKTYCVSCGQCALMCPTHALTEAKQLGKLERVMDTSKELKVVQIAPSVRVSLGECFGLKPGKIVTGQVVAALKKAGFDRVFDTNFSADLTIVEEATEFVDRMNKGQTPLFSSCCPAWIDFCCEYYPQFIPNLSTAKSPQQMLGAMIRAYFAKKINTNPRRILSVSVMPCTAKKKEAKLKEMHFRGKQDIDYVITTRELAEFLKRKNINPVKLKPEKFDSPLGESTGAGSLFGASGGVMEAALRTAHYLLEGKELKKVEIKKLRGEKGIREFETKIKGEKIKTAIAHGLGNARALLERIKKGEEFNFVEVMACPGGCIGGGGQPKPTDWKAIEKRAKAIYKIDKSKKIRRSHQNKGVKLAYKEFLGEPCSKKAMKLLHRSYPKKGKTR